MSNTGKILIVVGLVLLVVGLGGGLGLSLLGMIRVFEVTTTQGQPADPADLASGINTSLLALAVGLPISLVGLVVLVVGLVVGLGGNRSRGTASPASGEQP